MANTLVKIKKSFPVNASKDIIDDDENPFERCPAESQRTLLKEIAKQCASDEGKQFFNHANHFKS